MSIDGEVTFLYAVVELLIGGGWVISNEGGVIKPKKFL
jgi:hypothetical protein